MRRIDIKLGKGAVESLCFRTSHVFRWQGNALNFRRGWQWFLEVLGGWQRRQYMSVLSHCLISRSVATKSAPTCPLSQRIDNGFALIEEEPGRLGSEWTQVQWITHLVAKSLRALQSDGVLALPVEDLYFILTDVGPSRPDSAMVKSMKTIAVGILGGPGSGRHHWPGSWLFWKRELQLAWPPFVWRRKQVRLLTRTTWQKRST